MGICFVISYTDYDYATYSLSDGFGCDTSISSSITSGASSSLSPVNNVIVCDNKMADNNNYSCTY